MKTFELEGKGREIVARSADQKRALKAMRKNNEIPAVLYGGEKVTHFTVTKGRGSSSCTLRAVSSIKGSITSKGSPYFFNNPAARAYI